MAVRQNYRDLEWPPENDCLTREEYYRLQEAANNDLTSDEE